MILATGDSCHETTATLLYLPDVTCAWRHSTSPGDTQRQEVHLQHNDVDVASQYKTSYEITATTQTYTV